MADLATPSAAAISTSDQAPTTKPTKNVVQKPEKPDEAAFRAAEAKAEKEHKETQEKLNKIKEKIDNRPGNKDSPSAKRSQEIKNELQEIRAKQQGSKNSRTAVMDQVKRLDEQLKSRSNELKTARGSLKFKSTEDIDREIASLQKQVDAGTMKIVDEKKALAEISNLNKQRKNFSGFDAQEKQIQDVKNQIAEKKKLLDDPEQKALSERYNTLQTELNGIRAESDVAFKNLNALRDERTKLHGIQQEKYTALKKIRDDFHAGRRAHREYENEAWKIRQAKKKADDDAYHAKKRKDQANIRLEEASAPAYGDQINAAEGLIRYFDPSSVAAKTEAGPGKFAASSQRTVDDSGFKGARVVKKEEEDYFAGTGGKKGKKGRKAGAAASTPTDSGKLNLNLGILEELAKVGVSPPGSQAQVPEVVTQLKEKLAQWKDDQDRKTKENIAKAQKEIEKLEAEGEDGSRDAATKPSQVNQGVNGRVSAEAELKQENEAVADATEELEKAKIEDGEAVEPAS